MRLASSRVSDSGTRGIDPVLVSISERGSMLPARVVHRSNDERGATAAMHPVSDVQLVASMDFCVTAARGGYERTNFTDIDW